MKFIRFFESFEENEEILDDLNLIWSELSDEFYIDFKIHTYSAGSDPAPMSNRSPDFYIQLQFDPNGNFSPELVGEKLFQLVKKSEGMLNLKFHSIWGSSYIISDNIFTQQNIIDWIRFAINKKGGPELLQGSKIYLSKV
jgi:hypothetical protein